MEHVGLLSCLWLSNRAIMGRVDIGMGCMLHWQVVTWAGQWRQVAEEECTCAEQFAVGQHRYCLGYVGGRQHGRRAFGAADATMPTAGLVLDGGMRLLGHTPHPLRISCSRLQWEERVRPTAQAGCISHRPCNGNYPQADLSGLN